MGEFFKSDFTLVVEGSDVISDEDESLREVTEARHFLVIMGDLIPHRKSSEIEIANKDRALSGAGEGVNEFAVF